MLYFDAAFIAKFYLQEPESDAVRAFTEDSPGIASMVIGRLETELVFSRKLREGALTPLGHEALIAQFQVDCEDGLWNWLPVTDELVAAAQATTRGLPAGVFVRSLDALHLTCARWHGHERIYSNDKHLVSAAPHFGLQPGSLGH
ncbi:MAG TPA: type II toxin-antitoxin system VapC family toxin [Thermoanaerobaculia bacterium]|jgi:predicted nucleic acid-binding protein|nr:type II toxin-antitoxin system VapC family toxin [Thermoanaerobaculia bacterium]